jgi:tetratricopeptide (TPR) repeat protein
MWSAGCSSKRNYLEYYERGKTLYSLQRLEEAIPYFEKAISLNRKFKQAYVMTAKCYFFLNKERSAIYVLKKILRMYPNYVDANYWIGRIYYFLNEYEKSIQHLLLVIDEDSNHIDARYLLGDIYFMDKAYENALINFSVVEENFNIIALSKMRKSKIYSQFGQFEKVMEELKFIEMNKDMLNHSLLIEAYELLSEVDFKEAN